MMQPHTGLAAILLTTVSQLLACVPEPDASLGEVPIGLSELSLAACEAQGGVPMFDPGDGSLFEDGCDGGAPALGMISEDSWIESGLCCPPLSIPEGRL